MDIHKAESVNHKKVSGPPNRHVRSHKPETRSRKTGDRSRPSNAGLRNAKRHQDIQDAANENIVALTADYGITAATLSGLQTRIDAYRLAIPSPSVARSNRRSKTELVKVELDRTCMICKERLDGLMEQFKAPQPDFYNAYQVPATSLTPDTGKRRRRRPRHR